MNIPPHYAHLNALTNQTGDVVDATQFAVLDPVLGRIAYGDQQWVADGRVLDHDHPDGRIQYRRIHITYGEWTDVPWAPK